MVLFTRQPPRTTVRFASVSANTWGANDPAKVLGELESFLRHNIDRVENLEGGTEAWQVPIRALAARDYELIAKRAGTDELESVLDRIRAADPQVEVLPLEQVADVFQGVSYDRTLVTEHREGDPLTPLVRVGDIATPRVKQPTLFLTATGEARVRDGQRLGSGDVLITTSGTVGKIALLEGQQLKGAVAAKSIGIIRPGQRLAPAFLAALLRSPAYREWILGHARGSVIQHLSIRTLRKLPIALPPLPVQDTVLRSIDASAGALMPLLRHLTGGTSDPIAAWLESGAVTSLLSRSGRHLEQDFVHKLGEHGLDTHLVSAWTNFTTAQRAPRI